MTGSAMTFTYDGGEDGAGLPSRVRKVFVDWTSDSATGAVTGTTRKVSGRLVKAVTDPGATAPTDNYDIAITDPEGMDVLAGCKVGLANRDTANSEETYFFVLSQDTAPLCMATHPIVCDELTIAVTNAGNSKTGQLILYVET